MTNVSCAMIWLVRLCVLPAPAADDAGDASFLAPSRAPTQKVHTGSRARAPKAAERSAHKEQPASQPFLTVFTAFCRARTEHRRRARQLLATKCAKMSLACISSVPSKNQCFMVGEAFWKEVSMMQTKPHALMMSATRPKPCTHAMFCERFPQASKTASPSW